MRKPTGLISLLLASSFKPEWKRLRALVLRGLSVSDSVDTDWESAADSDEEVEEGEWDEVEEVEGDEVEEGECDEVEEGECDDLPVASV